MADGNGKDTFSKVLEEMEKLQAAVEAQRETVKDLLGAAAAVNASVAELDTRTLGVKTAVNALGMVLRDYGVAARDDRRRLEERLHAIEVKLGMAS